MKIAIVSPDYPSKTSKALTFVHVRAKWYQKSGHSVEIFVPYASRSDSKFEGITIHRIPTKQFHAEINKYTPDVLAVFYPTYRMVPTLRTLSLPKVVWILGHELLWSFRLMSAKNRLDWIKKRLVLVPRLVYQLRSISQLVKEADHSIFVSHWLLRAAQRHALTRFENARVIPNPVDTEMFSYRTPKNFSRAVSVRSLERSVYGLDVAIKAFANLEQADLTLHGSGRFYHKFRKMIDRYNSNTRIEVGDIPHHELPKLYRQYDFFVAPSRRETQGLAMCEAMACGLPVVASNVGGIPEFVRDGVDGYLVPPDDPAALRNAILNLISDRGRYLEMSENARAHIVETCEVKMIIEKELQVLQRARRVKTLFMTAEQKRHALVGPPQLWKMKRDFQFDFLKRVGLLPEHYLLDIGCGTLRGGIPIINYLEKEHYFGLDSRKEILAEAREELASVGLEHKAPTLLTIADFSSVNLAQEFDFLWAFSVFIHMPDEVLYDCLDFVSRHISVDGSLFANVNIGEQPDANWQGFPIVYRSIDFYRQACLKHGLELTELGELKDFGHLSGVEAQDTQRMLRIYKGESQ